VAHYSGVESVNECRCSVHGHAQTLNDGASLAQRRSSVLPSEPNQFHLSGILKAHTDCLEYPAEEFEEVRYFFFFSFFAFEGFP
jgi:hypothetical protein